MERLEENVHSLELARKTLHAVMAKIGQGISNMQNIDTFLGLILETVTDGLGGKVGALLVLGEDRKTLTTRCIYGTRWSRTGRSPSTSERGQRFVRSLSRAGRCCSRKYLRTSRR